MKVAVIGATGKVGQRLTAELAARGHFATGIARRVAVGVVVADANDPVALAQAVRGHDAVFHAANFRSSSARSVLDALRDAGVPRMLVVGGAGTLFIRPGVQFVDSPEFPEVFRPEVVAGRDFWRR